MKSALRLFVFLTLIFFNALSATASPADVPLPGNVEVFAPEQNVPQEIVGFSGKWHGVWDGILEHILVVEEMTLTHAIVVYAVGTAPAWNIHQPRWYRVRAEYADNALVVKFPRTRITVTYKMSKDGTLAGTYESAQGNISRAKLKRLSE